MSNHITGQPTAYPTYGVKEIKMKNWFRRKLRNFIDGPPPEYAEKVSVSVEGGNTFRGDFNGWQFRMHRAVGGTILEAWRYPQQNFNNNMDSHGQEHELFIINQDEDFNVELPHILTQLALR